MNPYHCKPVISPRGHLFVSALIWSGIGIMLLYKGIFRYYHSGWLIFPAIFIGSIKSCLFLDRSAMRIIRRISDFPGKVWLFAVYPLRTWIMVAGMMAFGLFLKNSPTPTIVLFLVYCSVGWGLLFSGRNLWWAFFFTTKSLKKRGENERRILEQGDGR